jgi:hypothetical protein
MPRGSGLRNPQLQPVWSSVNPKSTTKRGFAEAQPYTVLIAPDGKVIYRETGNIDPLVLKRAIVGALNLKEQW